MKCKSYHFFFRNFSNPLKIKIISALNSKEMCVSELSEKLKIEQSKISHALASLRFCNLVESKQKGKNRIYSLNKKTVVPLLKLADKHRQLYCKLK